jgi:hypothetical protein
MDTGDPYFTQNDTLLGGINDLTTFGVWVLGQLHGTTTQSANLFSQKTSGIDLPVKSRWVELGTRADQAVLHAYFQLTTLDSDHNFAKMSAALQEMQSFARLLKRKHVSDHWTQCYSRATTHICFDTQPSSLLWFGQGASTYRCSQQTVAHRYRTSRSFTSEPGRRSILWESLPRLWIQLKEGPNR